MRIALLQLGYETNTFMKGTAGDDMYMTGGFIPAEKVESVIGGTGEVMNGALTAIKEEGETPVFFDMVRQYQAGATLRDDTVIRAMDHICGQLTEKKGTYDAIFFCMHGAGYSETIHDVDAYQLKRIREVVGDMKIMASLDLHANMTPEMVALSDGFFGIKTNPHVDFFKASYLGAKTLIRTMRGECDPKMVLRKVPMLISCAMANTIDGPCTRIKEHFEEYVKEHDLIDATFFHGFAATDDPSATAGVLAVADGRSPEKEADELAQYLWDKRDEISLPCHEVDEAIDKAFELFKDGYVVINDAADNPGSGCPGDNTCLLKEMIKRNDPTMIMGPLYDPEAAAECRRHKPGDRFMLSVGGKLDKDHSTPVYGEVELISLSDGTYTCVSPVHKNSVLSLGPSALLKIGNVKFIVVSAHMQIYDDRPFEMLGVNLKDYKIVGIKSANHFRAYFKDTADAIVTCDTPSIYPNDVTKLNYKHMPEGVYSLT
ncbi:MAG: M81 family metallopeptidase [Lachnospiraceae bacterium]|nr:M81 family metallopeptidase [Lachnospiraceae bacterium]